MSGKTATERLREMLDERGVAHSDHYLSTTWRDGHGILHLAGEPMADGSLVVDMLTPEQAIAATLGSDASAVRLAERLRSIAYEMRSVGASSMTPHELLACYANDVDKVADSLMFAATLGNSRAEGTCKFISSKGSDYPPVCSACGYELGIYDCEWFEDGTYGYGGNYCPNCGAKVIGG